MFGFKIISKKKYDAIVKEGYASVKRVGEIEALKQKIKDQAAIIESMMELNEVKAVESGCKVGPWCEDCRHCITFTQEDIKFMLNGDFEGYSFVGYIEKKNQYIYCKKHIHNICKGWNKNT